jgi:hypothetical protein
MATIDRTHWNGAVRIFLTSGATDLIYLVDRATEDEAKADSLATAAEFREVCAAPEASWFWPRFALSTFGGGGIWTGDLSEWRTWVEEA